MITIKKIEAIRRLVNQYKTKHITIGFIPTMGALHKGHLALIKQARAENNIVIVSIFVNPKQFNNSSDLKGYPRTLAQDKKLIANCVDLLFAPSEKEIYPEGFQTKAIVSKYSQDLEGVYRPGHFEGMATVVLKLLNICRPDKAYFGLKDYQQYAIVSQMVKDLNIDTKIVGFPTIRMPSGLAMSSRNVNLTQANKKIASNVFKILNKTKSTIQKGSRDPAEIESYIKSEINKHPQIKLEYSVVRSLQLEKIKYIDRNVVILTAFYVGGVRLIDNIIVKN